MHFLEVILALLVLFATFLYITAIMPAYRCTACRVQRTVTPTDDESEEYHIGRFAHPHRHHRILPMFPLQEYPSVEELTNRVNAIRDAPLDQIGNEFADTWLPDQITARHQIYHGQEQGTTLPLWARLIIDRSYGHQGAQVSAEVVCLSACVIAHTTSPCIYRA